ARLQLLSKVGTLAENNEYEEVLSAVARLSIPELADWCVIDIVDNGQVRRGKVAHADPTKVAIAEEILATSPKFHQKPMAQHILDGGSFLIPEVDLNKLEEKAADPRYTDIVRRLGARSVMVVPFVVLGTPVALATF